MKSLHSLPVGLLFLVLTSIFISCKEKQTPTLAKDASELYNKSVMLLTSYTDSIAASSDSTSLLELDSRFENLLTKLNYDYPAGTDYEITEGQNDTLTMLSSKYLEMKDSMLKVFAGIGVRVDTTANDSISIPAL